MELWKISGTWKTSWKALNKLGKSVGIPYTSYVRYVRLLEGN